MERSGYPYGKKPWLRRDSGALFQRTVVSDHGDLLFVLGLVLLGLAVAALALFA